MVATAPEGGLSCPSLCCPCLLCHLPHHAHPELFIYLFVYYCVPVMAGVGAGPSHHLHSGCNQSSRT